MNFQYFSLKYFHSQMLMSALNLLQLVPSAVSLDNAATQMALSNVFARLATPVTVLIVQVIIIIYIFIGDKAISPKNAF